MVKEQYEKVIAAGGRIAGPAADALLTNSLDEDTIDWLKTNFFKTELELGHCLRLPQEGPCECDLYLRCSKFFTTSQYAPRLRARLAREQQLIQDATERGWPREVQRHKAVIARIHELLTQLGEDTQPNIAETCHFAATERARCKNCSRRMRPLPCTRCRRTRPVAVDNREGLS